MDKKPHVPKLASAKQKAENKQLQQENAALRLKNYELVQLFRKHNLLEQTSRMDCLCKTDQRCVSCEARDILVQAGFNVNWDKKEKSSIILPGATVPQ